MSAIRIRVIPQRPTLLMVDKIDQSGIVNVCELLTLTTQEGRDLRRALERCDELDLCGGTVYVVALEGRVEIDTHENPCQSPANRSLPNGPTTSSNTTQGDAPKP